MNWIVPLWLKALLVGAVFAGVFALGAHVGRTYEAGVIQKKLDKLQAQIDGFDAAKSAGEAEARRQQKSADDEESNLLKIRAEVNEKLVANLMQKNEDLCKKSQEQDKALTEARQHDPNSKSFLDGNIPAAVRNAVMQHDADSPASAPAAGSH